MDMTFPTSQAVWPFTDHLIDPDFAARVPDIDIYTLSNGIRVVLLRDGSDRSSHVRMLVNAGALHQTPGKGGIAHFVEHMLFKQTEKFATSKDLMDYSDKYNVNYNAYTNQDVIAVYATSDNDLETTEVAMDIVSQLCLHTKLPENLMGTEKGIVISERKAMLSEPDSFSGEVFRNHFFTPEHPNAGGGTIGTEGEIENYSHADMTDFYQEYFDPGNMLLIVSGGLPKRTYRKLISKYFEIDMPAKSWNPNPILNYRFDPDKYTTEVEKDFNHVNVYLGYYLRLREKVDRFSKESIALNIASSVLAKRIFLDIREEQGLAYSTGAAYNFIQHGYFFEFYGEFSAENYTKGRAELERYAEKLLEKPITVEEFAEVMRRRKSVRWADSAREVVRSVGNNLFILGQLLSPEAFHRYYDLQTVEYVNKCTMDILKGEKLHTVVVGPIR